MNFGRISKFGMLVTCALAILLIQGCNTTSFDVRKKQEQSGQQSQSSAGSSGGGAGGQEQGSNDGAEAPPETAGGTDEGIMGPDSGQPEGSPGAAPPATGSPVEDEGVGAGPRHVGSAGSGAGHVTPDARDVPDQQDDDIVARQLREQAEQETDPELKERLWDEYRRYKAGQ